LVLLDSDNSPKTSSNQLSNTVFIKLEPGVTINVNIGMNALSFNLTGAVCYPIFVNIQY
jgi:hypothetical protein